MINKVLLFILLSVFLPTWAFAGSNDNKMPVHLLSYLARDYGRAVQAKQIVSKGEYAEQLEFMNEVQNIAKRQGFSEPIKILIAKLKQDIINRADISLVSKLATEIKNQIIKEQQIKTYPSNPPNYLEAAQIYKSSCIQCHGITGEGNGPLAKSMVPAPTSFLDLDRMQGISPYQVYSTISLGVQGTEMGSFQQLSESDRWSLAFYISAMRYIKQDVTLNDTLSLPERSSLSDKQLLKKYNISSQESLKFLASIRKGAGKFSENKTKVKTNSTAYLELAKMKLEESIKLFEKGKHIEANSKALQAYLQGVEPVEGYLRSTNEPLVLAMEKNMMTFRNLLKGNGRNPSQLREKYQEILVQLNQAKKYLSSESSQLEIAFISFGIVLREATEAGLILLLLFSVIKKLDLTEFSKWIHAGWISALIFGALVYFVMQEFFQLTGKLAESVEGYVGLFATLVLLYVGFWFQRNSNIHKWKQDIKRAVENSALNGKKMTVFFIAFISVFREEFETLLFIKIMSFDGHSNFAIASGAIVAIIFSCLMVFLAMKFSLKIKFGLLFKFSTAIILFLAVVIMGKSIGSLQKAGVLMETQIDLTAFQPIGFNSTMEVLVSQLMLLLVVTLAYLFILKRKKINI